jgi:pimeloyl-ACP methyl ester carboxylesterase
VNVRESAATATTPSGGNSARQETALRHEFADVNSVRLHYVRAGSGPLMVFLHGFPQGWFIFRRQLEAFARDHTVVAADLRGYNLSSKPARPWEYGSWASAEDTRALVRHLGFDTFTLVGHDTGGTVGYSLALHHPDLLDRLVILSTAHPATFDRELNHNPDQIAASQYLLYLRRPDSAAALAANDFAALRTIFAPHRFFSEEDMERHLEAWRQPGATQGMLGWYQREGLGPRDGDGTPARGNFVPEVSPLVIDTPSLVVYAENDEFIRPSCFAGLGDYMPNLALHEVSGASHWLLDEHADLINDYIRDFVDTTPMLGSKTGTS